MCMACIFLLTRFVAVVVLGHRETPQQQGDAMTTGEGKPPRHGGPKGSGMYKIQQQLSTGDWWDLPCRPCLDIDDAESLADELRGEGWASLRVAEALTPMETKITHLAEVVDDLAPAIGSFIVRAGQVDPGIIDDAQQIAVAYDELAEHLREMRDEIMGRQVPDTMPAIDESADIRRRIDAYNAALASDKPLAGDWVGSLSWALWQMGKGLCPVDLQGRPWRIRGRHFEIYTSGKWTRRTWGKHSGVPYGNGWTCGPSNIMDDEASDEQIWPALVAVGVFALGLVAFAAVLGVW